MKNKNLGALYLIPVGLIKHLSYVFWMPNHVLDIARNLTIYIAEKDRSARSFMKNIGHPDPNQACVHTIQDDLQNSQIISWLEPILTQEKKIGLISDAGAPTIADPGKRIVRIAHKMHIQVIPCVGPCSILLGLMSSGLEGQRFVFHGYPSINKQACIKYIRECEKDSLLYDRTQVFIEAPHRNTSFFSNLIESLHYSTSLSLACALMGENEFIKTYTVKYWNSLKTKTLQALSKEPTLFLFQKKVVYT